MHGRTASKELDPGRYLRWTRAGIVAVALDLPGHGDRATPGGESPEATLANIEQMASELDGVVDELVRTERVDPARLALGGMSAGGMAALARLSGAVGGQHRFVAGAVECTTGDFSGLYLGQSADGARTGVPAWGVAHDPEMVRRLDPGGRVGTFRPVPLLILHNELDEVIPIGLQEGFAQRLGAAYAARGKDQGLIEWHAFGPNGSPQEHAGFGRLSNEAKNVQTAFLARVLGAG
jgi:dienelactone hydrolase